MIRKVKAINKPEQSNNNTYSKGSMNLSTSNDIYTSIVSEPFKVKDDGFCVDASTYLNTYDTPNIKIKYFDDDMPRLSQANGSDWIDLYTDKDIHVGLYEHVMIPLGVAMKLPNGYEAIIAPRSSTYKKYGLIQTNSIGIIDNSYSGNNDQWMFSVIGIGKTIDIPKYTRLCQFRIQKKQPTISFTEVSKLDSVDRGGFGSTGD